METLTALPLYKGFHATIWNEPMFRNHPQGCFYWGKCYLTEDRKYVGFMQGLGTCKDYVVDTYYRTYSNQFDPKFWNNKQIMFPSVYMFLDRAILKKAIQNVKEVLNPWEEKNGFMPSKLYTVDFKDATIATPNASKYVLVLEYDPQWMDNAMVMSFFLSVVRHSIVQENVEFSKGSREKHYGNEYSYYKQASDIPIYGKVLDYTLENPRVLLEFTKGAPPTGYPQGTNSHGSTGIFHIMKYLWYRDVKDNPSGNQSWKNSFGAQYKDHTLTKYIDHVIELLTPAPKKKEETPNVKMQSLQPKTTRARASKKVTPDPWPLWAHEPPDIYRGNFTVF